MFVFCEYVSILIRMTESATSIHIISSISDDKEKQDSSNNTSQTDREFSEVLNEIVPSFGNIALKNSNDFRFENKTHQGPVTIKQILYTNSHNSECDSKISVCTICSIASDNPCFAPDNLRINTKTGNQHESDATTNRGKQTKGRRWLQKFSWQHLFLIVSLVTVLLLSLVTLLAVLLTRHHQPYLPQYTDDRDKQHFGISPKYPVDSKKNNTITPGFRLILRSEWGAKPSKEKPDALQYPVPYVIIMHTASTFCNDKSSCKKLVQEIQGFHANGRGWSDIGYNFLVGGDGNGYKGRGWDAVGAQVFGYNTRCIGIAFIGTFNQVLPPKSQLTAAKEIIQMGLNLSVIAVDYKLLAARQLQTTQSPGEALYELIKTWDHWSPTS